jgi:3-oxoacyl-[acyl-carrier protein] reductase
MFDAALAVNLRAPFLLAQAALGGMRAHGFGRILFISSAAAFTGGVVGPHYAASKAGLHGMAHFLAARTAVDGVTVNVLAPGFIDKAMLPGSAEELGNRVPVGRVGTAQEVADLAVAMLRNGYATSHVFTIDGGAHPR